MPVTTRHPQYVAMQDIWMQGRDTSEGNHAIKAGGDTYLPRPTSWVGEHASIYDNYKLRSYFMGVTGRTQDALLGMIFRKPPEVDLPPRLDRLVENIDGMGQSLEQIAKEAAGNIMEVGRHIFFVDYPKAPAKMNAEQEQKAGYRPLLLPYPAEALINWKSSMVNGVEVLTLAVLAEYREKDSLDPYAHEREEVFRVLEMKEGVFTVRLEDSAGNVIEAETTPRMAGGRPFDHIPIHIAGALNNKPDCDIPPLYDLGVVNIAHYQTTADHRQNLFIHGQVTLGISTEMDYEDFAHANKNGVQVGAPVGHFLGKGGSFQTATAPESSSLRVALQDLEAQMVALGARLVQRGSQTETAEAARINASAEASTLDLMVGNLSEAIEAALEDMARYMGENPDVVEYELNRDYWEANIDPNSLNSIMAAYQGRLISKTVARDMIRSGKIAIPAGRTDEEIDQEIASDILDELPSTGFDEENAGA